MELARIGFDGRRPTVEVMPDPRAYTRLVERHGHDRGWHGYPVGLGDADTEALFHLAENPLLSSFLSAIHPSVCKRVRVPIRRLDGMLAGILHDIAAPRVFLKTDTQGFDLHVLRGAGGCLDAIIGILAEISVIPIYEQSPTFHEAVQAYQDAGFDIVDLGLVNRTVDGRVLEFDGLFVRRPLAAKDDE